MELSVKSTFDPIYTFMYISQLNIQNDARYNVRLKENQGDSSFWGDCLQSRHNIQMLKIP